MRRWLVATYWAATGIAAPGVTPLAVAAQAAQAAPAAARIEVRGVVRDGNGVPVPGTNVFVLETLDGVLTDADGRFAVVAAAAPPLTLVIKRLGFASQRWLITAGDSSRVVVTLARASVALTPITVQAGAYTADEERGSTLTPLEVVTTPGAAADLTRAVQALPGVQTVDEGNALFVRGGDYTETKIFLNEAPLLNPQQLVTPSGTFIGTVDPFQLDGIFFSSGGFGARYGNALSGVAGLRTRGRASRLTSSASLGLAALSADVGVPLTSTLSLRAAANRFDLTPMFRVNGSSRRYEPPPRGRDLSASATWNYRDGAEVKVFAIDQTSVIGVGIDDPGFSGTFGSDDRTRFAVLTWRDVIGRISPSLSLSHTTQRGDQSFGLFRLTTDLAQSLLFAQAEWALPDGATLRAGGDVERVTSAAAGTLPDGDSRSPGAPRTLFTQQRSAVRVGPFAELDWRVGDRTRLIAGVRGDHSQLTREWTVDPRLSVAWRPREFVTLTAAWGIYHQVAAPLQYDSVAGLPGLPSMRASQFVLGMQLGEDPWLWRVEAYGKRYRDLVQLTRRGVAVGDGTGSARGVDVFAKTPLPLGVQLRATFSLLSAERTDPNTGGVARAPFDISRSETIIAEKRMRGGLRLAVAYRYATGRPFTPVSGATRDPASGEFVPDYGASMSDRLPPLRRIDLSTSWYRPLTPHWQGVFYVSVNNVADRDNLQSYTWSSDYSERIPVRSIFKRSVYFGATLIRQ